jgi:hypothetical protein
MAAVAPQMKYSPSSPPCPARASTGTGAGRLHRSKTWRRWCAGVIRNCSGTSKASATSKASSAGRTAAAPGHHRRDDEVRDRGVDRQPADHFDMVGRRPTSSSASRSAVATGSASCVFGFAAPPGKADLPGMVAQVFGAARQQHRRPSSRCTRPTSTAAAVGWRDRRTGRPSPGSRAAIKARVQKRRRSASAVSRGAPAAGRWSSPGHHGNGVRILRCGVRRHA